MTCEAGAPRCPDGPLLASMEPVSPWAAASWRRLPAQRPQPSPRAARPRAISCASRRRDGSPTRLRRAMIFDAHALCIAPCPAPPRCLQEPWRGGGGARPVWSVTRRRRPRPPVRPACCDQSPVHAPVPRALPLDSAGACWRLAWRARNSFWLTCDDMCEPEACSIAGPCREAHTLLYRPPLGEQLHVVSPLDPALEFVSFL